MDLTVKKKRASVLLQTDDKETSKKSEMKEEPPTKRQRYTFDQKRNILEERKIMTTQEISQKYGINDCLLRKWKSQQDLINTEANKGSSKNLKSKSRKGDFDSEMYAWLSKCRDNGIPVSGPMIRTQALIIYKEFDGPKDFKASQGWLDKWKKRTGVKNLKITGEKLSADEKAAILYKSEFAKLVSERNFDRAQIFNMDESGLMYKSTPKRSFVPADHVQASGGKKQLERVTIATCCNADASCVLPLILIGKSENPKCFKNLNKDHLPVWYRNQKNAWMNLQIFEEWFKDVFVPRVENFLRSKGLPLEAVLLVDNCKSHKIMKINNIEVQFLPPNVTSLIQPMDQGIIQSLKIYYESKLVKEVIDAQDNGIPLLEFLKTIDLYKVVVWISEAWDKVKSSTIYKCWNVLWPIEKKDVAIQTDPCSYTIDNLDSSVDTDVTYQTNSSNSKDVTDLLGLLKRVQGYEFIDAATVLNWITKTEKVSEEEVGELPTTSHSNYLDTEEDFSKVTLPDSNHQLENQSTSNNEGFDFNTISSAYQVLYEEL